ncbi:hypothetical protein QQX98_000458 [Neonectria punicea]|uniref:Heterokaryon incompatibility domain-containing protein n=1 Tax=Neonectria punicea TaxID=979145 RepID=A0ABR1HTC8_9HYPO
MLPIVEIIWIGLWDPEEEFDEQNGRCRVQTRGYLDVIACTGDPASDFVTTRPINPRIGSADNFSLSRRWIQVCLHTHDSCPTGSLDFMPKRVLELQHDGAGRYHVSLHQPSSLEPYVALSYCWGGDQPQKTTKAKMNSGNLEVDWEALPRSIQDAIKVTIGLGYRYLWVDSLCIVQDDDQEKAKQIALMPKIYAKALVTILASRAERAVDGFLNDIDVNSLTELCVKLPFKCPNSPTSGTVFIAKMRNSTNTEPIDYRGWTLQERYLSPRVLDYSSNQLSWMCTTSLEDPGYSDGWRAGTRQDEKGLYPVTSFYRKPWGQSEANGVHSAVHTWRSIVETYTRRRLTFPKDRILAISGVAEMFASEIKDEYIIGHWKHSIPFDLLWSTVPGRPLQQRQSDYQAPSWSWAAVTAEIWYNFARAASPSEYEPPKPAISLSEMETELEEETAIFGAASNGYVRGRGRFRSLVWFGNQETPDYLHVLHDRDPAGNFKPVPLLRMTHDAIEKEFAVKPLDKDTFMTVHLLHVGTCSGWGLRGIVGLVLREVSSEAHGSTRRRFTRLGVFHINSTSKRKKKALGVPRSFENVVNEDMQRFFENENEEDFEIV